MPERRKPAYLQADLPGEAGRKQMRGLQKRAAMELYPSIPGRPREAQAEDLMQRTREAQGEQFLRQPPGIMDRLQAFGQQYVEPMFMPVDPETGMPNVDLAGPAQWAAKGLRQPTKEALHKAINLRDVLYHGTDLPGARGILEKGQIWPPQDYLYTARAVSTSRAPIDYGGHGRGFSSYLTIDRPKVPGGKPVEKMGAKTWKPLRPGGSPPAFEFETRFMHPIDVGNVKQIIVDRESLAQEMSILPERFQGAANVDEVINRMRTEAAAKGVDVIEVPNFKAVQSYRARIRPEVID